jgi:23S rRNA 5-hydroxycytidine C2501 synthase
MSGSSRGPLLQPGALELLAPARDLACVRAAIDCGADAVYLGAPRFGAREAAGNLLADIRAAAAYAHRYWARLYVALNTLLTDTELPEAERLAWELAEAGADALIVQDVGLLECALPPLPLIASTQMHNHTPARVAFLANVGFHRAILARELDLAAIRSIREAAPAIELECFIHGALCVSYSGQCALSYALGGRSGNRGQCAQPCRKPYRLLDARSRPVGEWSHWLSLRDLNLTAHLGELVDAGVTSFKIEGRLKDRAYVANAVAHYRRELDAVIRARGLRQSAAGLSSAGFVPDPAKTFNRGFTTYFLHGRNGKVASTATPKIVGEDLGPAAQVAGDRITLSRPVSVRAGDGLCFFAQGELLGTRVNTVEGARLQVQDPSKIRPGTILYRNYDHAFVTGIDRARMERRVAVQFTLRRTGSGVSLTVLDENGIEVNRALTGQFESARQAGALETIRKQLGKTGGTHYACRGVSVEADPPPFLPLSALNALRRDALDALTVAREDRRPRPTGGAVRADQPSYPERELSCFGNVLNTRAAAFYRRHGVTRIEPAAETGLDLRGRKVMTTRYCIKHQLDLCGTESAGPDEPWYLVDDRGQRLRLVFDCPRCGMDIYLE